MNIKYSHKTFFHSAWGYRQGKAAARDIWASPRTSPTTQEAQLQDCTAAPREIQICSVDYHSFAEHQAMNESIPKEMSHFVSAVHTDGTTAQLFMQPFPGYRDTSVPGSSPCPAQPFHSKFSVQVSSSCLTKDLALRLFSSLTSISTCSLRSFLLKIQQMKCVSRKYSHCS